MGLGGRTMMKNGDSPYWNEPEYMMALESNPNMIILMLGTNDAKYF